MSGYSGFYFLRSDHDLCLLYSNENHPLSLWIGPKSNKIKSSPDDVHRFQYKTLHVNGFFVISGMYAGLAGALLAVTDPLAGAERMQWTASGEVVLMTILVVWELCLAHFLELC